MTLAIKKPTSGKLVMAKGQPVAIDPNFSSVRILLHGEGINGSNVITDSGPSALTVTAVSSLTYQPQISNAQAKYGSTSIRFAYDSVANLRTSISPINIRTTPFTVEAWIYRTVNQLSLVTSSDIQPNQLSIGKLISNSIYLGDGTTNNLVVSGSSLALNAWQHIAYTFDLTTYRLFLDGTQLGSSTTLLKDAWFSNIQVAVHGDGGGSNISYLDEFRFSAMARYTVGTGANAGKMVFAGTNTLALPTAPFIDF